MQSNAISFIADRIELLESYYNEGNAYNLDASECYQFQIEDYYKDGHTPYYGYGFYIVFVRREAY